MLSFARQNKGEPSIMTPSPAQTESMAGRRVLVVGLGRFGGGVGVTRWLAGLGARITVTDAASAESLAESVEGLAGLNVTYHLGGHDVTDLAETELAVINPAIVKHRSDFFKEIVRRRIPWTTELNLFCERCPAKVIGVTGSYGKSTTCAMLTAALEACIQTGATAHTGVYCGGNIGRSLLNDLPAIRETDLVVLEMSNAQLEDLPRIRWAPDLAVITNIVAHHLDRYESFEAYIDAKFNIIRDPLSTGRIIVGDFAPEAKEMFERLVGQRSKRVLQVAPADPPVRLCVPGGHNLTNAHFVLAVTDILGLDQATVRAALAEFKGLEHRLQVVRVLDGVAFLNDSKSTSPDAIRCALASLDTAVVAIVGGQRSEAPLQEVATALAGSCSVVVCMGQSGPAYVSAITEAVRCQGTDTQTIVCDDLPAAVSLARSAAREGGTVLFSPGAPSFDCYHNFAQRGQDFITIVEALK